jgi:hypothetical protein
VKSNFPLRFIARQNQMTGGLNDRDLVVMLPDLRFDVRGSLRQFSIGLQRQIAIQDNLVSTKVRNPSGSVPS